MGTKESFIEWAGQALGAETREEVEIDHELAREQFAEWLNQKAEARVARSPFPPVEEVHDRKTRDAFAEWFREKEAAHDEVWSPFHD